LLGSLPICHPLIIVSEAADAGALASKPAERASGAASSHAFRILFFVEGTLRMVKTIKQ